MYFIWVTKTSFHPYKTRKTVAYVNFLFVVQVIGNKWDMYLDLLQSDYSEG